MAINMSCELSGDRVRTYLKIFADTREINKWLDTDRFEDRFVADT